MAVTSEALESLRRLGLHNLGGVHWNLPVAALYEESIRRGEAMLCREGPILIHTGRHTGRSPRDRFIVRESANEGRIGWGEVNRGIDPDRFRALQQRVCAYLQGRDVFVMDCQLGADREYRLDLRVVSESASGALFSRIMFLEPRSAGHASGFEPTFTILHVPEFHADPERDGVRSDAFILLNLERGIVLIGGTGYAGEIKKSMFTVMNYLLPLQGVLPMHCSANYGESVDDVSIFFGLSGTGKTTLSADPARTLIGDDEHGWSDRGVFNFEGGCYAKAINLSPEAEPEIFQTTRRFGTLLENVAIDPLTRELDFHDARITENTRVAYPITHIHNMARDGVGGHPAHIFMLTCDAYGVMPPISRLTPEQAMYHFLSGYTAKVAGTEAGVTEPEVVFSPCFGAPFMPLPPSVYAALLGRKIAEHRVDVWLVNTGWSGGPYGEGKRIALRFTRSMIDAAMRGALEPVPLETDPVFGVGVPLECPGVPDEILIPRNTWSDPNAYDAKARELAMMFHANFERHAADAPPEITEAGPRVVS